MSLIKCPKNEELELLLDSLTNLRAKLLFAFPVYMGLRVSEVVSIKVDSIDFFNSILTLERQKNGDIGEQVPIPAQLMKMIAHYMDNEIRFKNKRKQGNPYLFPSCSSTGHMTTTAPRLYIHRLRKQGNLPFLNKYYKINPKGKQYNFSYHSLRHWYGSYAYKKTRDIYAVSKMLRHKSINNTMIYMSHNIDEKREIADMLWGSDAS